jgi:hypothetical protein
MRRALREFNNRVMWKATEPERVEGTEDWRKLQNEELHTPRRRFTGNMAHVTKKGIEYRVLVGKYEQNIWKTVAQMGE